MRGVFSLRSRLTIIILAPLILVALGVGYWQLENARRTAQDVFDRSLLSAALAVANDVVVSGGDALSPRTSALLADTSGGPVFYHVYAPDGVIVAGYATPPSGIPRPAQEVGAPNYFDATYLGRPVHGVRLQNRTQIDGFSGVFTTTVWQSASVRTAFVSDLLTRAVIAIAGLIVALGLIVWFGVRLGLRPLTNLEAAIASRSGSELNPIQRAVPQEVQGIVATLNRLFSQVNKSMTAQSDFISNAAHQLRNPIAGVLSLAEAVHTAPGLEQARERSRDLLDATRETANLSQQLLLFERAKTISPSAAMARFDLDVAFADWAGEYGASENGTAEVVFAASAALGEILADETMLREALRNLVDNALRHGGAGLSRVTVLAGREGAEITLSVADNGVGLTDEALAAAGERFRTFSATSRSGLGISIADAVAQGHGGTLTLRRLDPGLLVEMRLPVVEIADPRVRTH